MRASLLGFALGLACASPALAEPELNRNDWECLLGAATPSEQVALQVLGPDCTLDADGAEGRHYAISRAPYAGGVDLYMTPRGELQEALFYLVEGPLYLESQIQRAAAQKSPYTLADVERWYGTPFERKSSGRTGATTLTYHFQGDAARNLLFSSLPHSIFLHRIIVSRGTD